jgi:hypothetical protein
MVCSGIVCAGANPPTGVGRFVDNLTDPSRRGWTSISTVGRALPPPTSLACPAAALAGYGPVYSSMASGTTRIIGFTRIGMTQDPARPANPCAKLVSRAPSIVSTGNATAVLSDGLPLPISAQPAELAELLDKHLQRNGLNYSPVLVAALAR